MTFYVLPTSKTFTWYTFTISLSESTYTFEMRFNSRMGRWIMDIKDASETPIVLGIPLLVNRTLTSQYTALELPPGQLFVLDQSGLDAQPGLGSFLRDHKIYYAEAT